MFERIYQLNHLGLLLFSIHSSQKVNLSRICSYIWCEIRGGYWLPRRHSGKESACQNRRCGRPRFDPWIGKTPKSRKWQPTAVFLPGKFHGQSCLAGYSAKSSTWLSTEQHRMDMPVCLTTNQSFCCFYDDFSYVCSVPRELGGTVILLEITMVKVALLLHIFSTMFVVKHIQTMDLSASFQLY